MLEANKDKHFVAPGIAWLINTARHAEQWGIKPGSKVAMRYERELEMCVETMKKMHRRGIRVCIGGDYGFAWTPQGTNAKDIQTFVEMLGFSPMEAIQAATKYGGEIMGMGNELGMIGKAIWPTCCWSTAIRSPTSASCRTRTASSRS